MVGWVVPVSEPSIRDDQPVQSLIWRSCTWTLGNSVEVLGGIVQSGAAN